MKKTPDKKPLGQPTRSKTASNRLRHVDNFILLYEPSLLTRTDGLFAGSFFVDPGYGFDPRTTLESAARFRRVNPNLPILGVEIEKKRVETGKLIYEFVEAWKRSAAETSPAKTFGLKQWFCASVENLAAKGFKIDLRKKWLGKGWLVWNQ